jgi:hypothetical protein
MTGRKGINKPIHSKDARIHTKNPPFLPSTIEVMKAGNIHDVSSSILGLSSIMDISMTEISKENQIAL